VLDTSKGKEPLSYFHGAGHMIPGLEAELEGKAAGDALQVVVPPETGYGMRNEGMIQDVPRDRFPEGMELEIGMTLQAQSPAGVQMVRVVAIEDDHVKLDGNHPLAGETLHFDVTIQDVREATPEEIAYANDKGASCGGGSCDTGGSSCNTGGCGH